MSSVAVVLILSALIVATVVYARRRAATRRLALLDIAAELAGTLVDSNRAVGRYDGVAVTYELTERGSGSSRVSWTMVEVELPRSYPLTLSVRRHALFDGGKIARGTMIDVEVGDDAFDTAYLVEAAPADVVTRLLDARLRSFLLEQQQAELKTVQDGARRQLQLHVMGWTDTPEAGMPLIAETVRLAKRVRESFGAVMTAAPVSAIDAPYRSEPRAANEPAIDKRVREVAHVDDLQRARAARDLRVSRAGLAVFVAVVAGLMLLYRYR